MVPGLGVVKALHGILNSSQFLLNNNNKGRRSNVNKHELVNCDCSITIILLKKKMLKVKDFSFIRKGPYYRGIFNKIQGYPALPPP